MLKMFENKKFIKKLSVALAVAFLGVGFGGLNHSEASNLSSSLSSSIASTKNTKSNEAYYVVKNPNAKSIKTVSISAKNKQYLASNFPIQKIGTTKSFKTKKSSGTIKYTAEEIILTEKVNIKNPQFTYLKKLPDGYTVKDIKNLTKTKYVGTGMCHTLWNGKAFDCDSLITTPDKKWTYTIDTRLRVDMEYINKNTASVTIHIPNNTYEQEKKKLNDAEFKTYLKEQNDKKAKEKAEEAKKKTELKQAKTEVSNLTKQKTVSDEKIRELTYKKRDIDAFLKKTEEYKKELTRLQNQYKKEPTAELEKYIAKGQDIVNYLEKERPSAEKKLSSLQSQIKAEQTKNNSLKQKLQKAKDKVTSIEKSSKTSKK